MLAINRELDDQFGMVFLFRQDDRAHTYATRPALPDGWRY